MVGNLAGSAKNNGDNNTFVGYSAGYGNAAVENTFIGAFAGFGNYSGRRNVVVGKDAFYTSSGQDNVVMGHSAGRLMGNSFQNVVIGHAALNTDMTQFNFGTTNGIVIGDSAGYNSISRTTVIIGSNAGHNYTGDGSVFIGYNTGYFTGGGFYNTIIGSDAEPNATGGSSNTYLGSATGWTNKTGSDQVLIGEQADVSSSNLSNAIAIGESAIVNASNKAVIGNNFMTSIGGKVGWSTFSDGRFKTNVKENVPGLAFILKLRPVTYNYDVAKMNSYFGANQNRHITNTSSVSQLKNAASNTQYTGFIAQEVESAAKTLGYEFSGVDKPAAEKDIYALRYAEFVVPLVKAVQEQQQTIDNLTKKNDDLQAMLNSLLQRIKTLETKVK